MKRKGYKTTILMGLGLYSLGAIMFWPTAHYASPDNTIAAFGGFLACTLVIACGLATLETAANSYAVVIGHPASASVSTVYCTIVVAASQPLTFSNRLVFNSVNLGTASRHSLVPSSHPRLSSPGTTSTRSPTCSSSTSQSRALALPLRCSSSSASSPKFPRLLSALPASLPLTRNWDSTMASSPRNHCTRNTT